MASKELCSACNGGPVQRNEILQCVICKDLYHYSCVNMTTAHYMANIFDLSRAWRCPSCLNITTRRKDANTPVRSQVHLYSPPAAENESEDEPLNLKTPERAPLEATMDIGLILNHIDSKLDEKLSNSRAILTEQIKSEFKATVDALKADFLSQITKLSLSIDEMTNNLSTTQERIKELEYENTKLRIEMETVKHCQADLTVIPEMKSTIDHLKDVISERDQQDLANDVELTGIPEFSGESAIHIVVTAAAKLGMTLDEREIVAAHRVGRGQRVAGGVGPGARPRPLAVRFARRVVRDELLRCARVRRHCSTADLGLPQHTPVTFYINERLTKSNRVLFAKAREAGRTGQWKFVWTRGGRIYARKTATEGSPIITLRNESDLHVFNDKNKDNQN